MKALISTLEGLELLVNVYNICWASENTPEFWKISQVALLYKKGDPSNCANYRPISLLCVGYKVLAFIVLCWLKHAGAESRIWNRKFGFKSKAGTEEEEEEEVRTNEVRPYAEHGCIHYRLDRPPIYTKECAHKNY